MASSVYALLLAVLCIQIGPTVQQLNKLKRKLNDMESTIDALALKTQYQILELHEAVDSIRNQSDVADESQSDAGAIASMRTELYKQRATVTALYKAFSKVKQHTRGRMNELDELMSELNEAKEVDKLKEELHDVRSDLLNTQEMNIKLTEYLQEIKRELLKTKETKMEQTKQIKKNEEDIFELRQVIITQMQQMIEAIQPSATTVPTQETTTEIEPSTTTVRVALATCPDGWKKLQDKCYLLVGEEKVTWNVAKTRCAQHGAVLAEPDTQEKVQFLWQMATEERVFSGNTFKHYIWLGGTDLVTKGTWIWNGSGRLMDSSLWVPGQPSWGVKACLVMDNSGWYDVPCTFVGLPYMCEKQVNV